MEDLPPYDSGSPRSSPSLPPVVVPRHHYYPFPMGMDDFNGYGCFYQIFFIFIIFKERRESYISAELLLNLPEHNLYGDRWRRAGKTAQ
ncbi:transmembrane protein, putative [Medicago truncatula]|uniref:Transmembrane protein, putative n=1 Tax=Medicago truncatula TaxID=3880 RepID=G7K1R3_MEDTR|nr:transmembrane protein, putative [Medicago truncatula]